MNGQTFLEWCIENHKDIMYNNACLAKLKDFDADSKDFDTTDFDRLHFTFPYSDKLPQHNFIVTFDNYSDCFSIQKNLYTDATTEDQLAILEYVWAYYDEEKYNES